jgi:hypothetical protein
LTHYGYTIERSEGRLIVSVSLAHPHPLCRIPALVPGAPARPVETRPGIVTWLRPERALVRDGDLCLHDWISLHCEAPLDHTLFRRLTRAATRFQKLAARLEISDPSVLDWPEPERIRFTTGNDPATFRRFHSRRHPSSEHLMLKRTPTSTSLVLSLTVE